MNNHSLEKKKRLILIDGSGFIFRAFHALPPMYNTEGISVNAVYGFTNMLLRYLEKQENTYRAVIFDAGRQTFRNAIYPLYKAHRIDVPEELIPQFPLIREACKAFNICSIEKAGYEADDLIATYALLAVEKGMSVTIVSSDKDLMQLVDDHIELWDPLKAKRISFEEVKEKFGVLPSQVAAVQALAGDTSDNIPGVPGIGPKTATALIQTFQSIENIYANIETVTPIRRKQLLEEHRENAFISQKLTLLDRQVPLDTPLEQLSYQHAEIEKIVDFLHKMSFKSLIQRFSKNFTASVEEKPSPSPFQHTLVTNINDLIGWIDKIKIQKFVAFDTETTSLNPDEAQLVGVSLAITPEQGCYIPLGHVSSLTLFEENKIVNTQISLQDFFTLFSPILQDSSILKIGHNIKYDCRVLQKYQVCLENVEDTMLMSYVLEEGQHNLDDLVKKHFDHSMVSFKEVIATVPQKDANFSHVSLEKACYYAAEDAVYTLRLYHFYQNLLNKPEAVSLKQVYSFIEKPLIPILCAIEQRGVYIDAAFLKKLSLEWEERLKILEQHIYQQAGHPFLIGSPKQLGTVLFEELKLGKKIKKGKSGIPSTNANVLEELAQQGHLLPQLILEWRQLAKLKGTYTDALIKQINPVTQRIHTSFLMSGTTTGRLASSDPNLQNIPIRTEEGKKIRHAFQAQEGNLLISADYSQIELRLLTHFADVPRLQETFQRHQDIHVLTASQIFRVSLEEVTPDLRRQAKAINFGIIYGISSFGLSKQLGIPTGMASEIIKAYFTEYPGINTYMEQMIKNAQSQGYVTTLYGRRCFIPEINNKNALVRNMSKRQAINAPLQGSNADIIKKAMIALPPALQEAGLNGKIILQVHDELIFEIPEPEILKTKLIIKSIMEAIAPELRIPLVIEIGVGKTWESAH